MHIVSHRGSSLSSVRHPIHACAPVRCVVVPLRSVALLPALPECLPPSSTRGSSPKTCATSAWGPWPLLTTRHPSQYLYRYVLIYAYVCMYMHLSCLDSSCLVLSRFVCLRVSVFVCLLVCFLAFRFCFFLVWLVGCCGWYVCLGLLGLVWACVCWEEGNGCMHRTRLRVYVSKRFRVYWQHAHMFHTCGLGAGTHADVLNVHTEAF